MGVRMPIEPTVERIMIVMVIGLLALAFVFAIIRLADD